MKYNLVPETRVKFNEATVPGVAEQIPIGLSSTVTRLAVMDRPLSGTPVILGHDFCGGLSSP